MNSLPRSLDTGVDYIDREHEYLIDRLDRLRYVCDLAHGSCAVCDDGQQSRCDTMLSEMLTELLMYMVEHFRHEESLMVGLPRWMREQHIIEHANIAERFTKMLQGDADGRAILASPTELQDIITHWLEDHIRQWDIPIASCLGAKSG